jgi:hypothetical protein
VAIARHGRFPVCICRVDVNGNCKAHGRNRKYKTLQTTNICTGPIWVLRLPARKSASS